MIPRGEIRVWRIDLEAHAGLAATLAPLLADDERTRASRFRFERHRRRFVVGRAATREIVGRCAEIEPRRVAFEYGPHGKPALAGGGGIEFNVSHSGDRAFIAVVRGRTVGGDIEVRRDVPDADAIARRFFNEREAAWIRDSDGTAKSDAFLRLWTRKEAYVKAVGGGLSIPLDGVDVFGGAGAAGPVLTADDGAATWTYMDFETWPDCLSSLVTNGDVPRIMLRDWTPACGPAGGTRAEREEALR